MRHIFLLKPVNDDYDHHPFIETIREVMQGYDYDIFMSTYPDHAKKIIKHKSCFAPCWYLCLFMIQYA